MLCCILLVKALIIALPFSPVVKIPALGSSSILQVHVPMPIPSPLSDIASTIPPEISIVPVESGSCPSPPPMPAPLKDLEDISPPVIFIFPAG